MFSLQIAVFLFCFCVETKCHQISKQKLMSAMYLKNWYLKISKGIRKNEAQMTVFLLDTRSYF
jgi:hypothetical protein